MVNPINPATGASGANIFPAAGSEGSGMLSNLFQNKLFLQYLAAAGQDIGSGGAIGTNVNAATQQNIASQNYAGLLQKMLGGEVPEGGKVTMDNKGLKMDLPSSALGNLNAVGTPDGGTGLQPTPVAPTGQTNQGMLSLLNPSASPLGDLTPADLAGLTTENLSQAVSLRQQKRSLDQTQRQRELQESVAALQKAQELDLRQKEFLKSQEIFASDIPGYGDLTFDQYKGLPTSDKEYTSYVLATRQLGQEPISKIDYETMSEEAKADLPTTAMGTSIAKYIDETGEYPSPTIMANWEDMFREKKTPSPVTWTTATNEVTKRFGKLDPTGMWAITSDLQNTHRKAQELLVEYKAEGVEPLAAINKAETNARAWTARIEAEYNRALDIIAGLKSKQQRERELEYINSRFLKDHGYIP